MASKIQGRDFDAPITPYTFEGNDYNTLRVYVDYESYSGYFYARLTPEKIVRYDGYATRCFSITGTRDPLGSWVTIALQDAPRNSSKKIYEFSTALETAKEAIALFWDKRDFTMLEWLVKSVASAGYTYTIEQKVKAYMDKENQATTNQTTTNQTTPNTETTMGTKNINSMAAQEFVGMSINVGGGVATISITKTEGDMLYGSFEREGVPSVQMPPFSVDNLRAQVKAGTWTIEGVSTEDAESATEDTEATIDEVEEVNDEGTEPAEDTAEEVSAEEPAEPTEDTAEGAEFTDYEEVTEESEEESLPSRGDLEGSDDPVLAQWREAKAKRPDSVIIFNSGKVFVTLMDDATLVHDLIGIPLTQQGGVTMCIFQQADMSWVMSMVVNAGHRAVVQDLQMPAGEEQGAAAEEPQAEAAEEPQAEEPVKARVQPRVKPKTARSDEPQAEAAETSGEESTASEEPQAEASEEPQAEEPVKPRVKPRVKRPEGAEVTVDAEAGVPRVVKVSDKSIVVTGNTERIEAVLSTLWGRKRPYTHNGKTYSGIQLSAKHRKTVDEIIKLAYNAA